MPDTYYTFHVPCIDPNLYGTIRVELENEHVKVITHAKDFEDLDNIVTYGFMEWEEAIRARGIVITPLITRAGAAVVMMLEDPVTKETSKRIACLIPHCQDSEDLLEPKTCKYHALYSSDNDVAELPFYDVLSTGLLRIGEILYLDMQVLEEEQFRSQGGNGKVLYTRLGVPHARVTEIGKLYVTCLYKPRAFRGNASRSMSAITLAVNPWDVQLATAYTGDPKCVVKHLR